MEIPRYSSASPTCIATTSAPDRHRAEGARITPVKTLPRRFRPRIDCKEHFHLGKATTEENSRAADKPKVDGAARHSDAAAPKIDPDGAQPRQSRKNAKTGRVLDLLILLPALPVLLLAWGMVAVWIKIVSPGGVFYRQTRIGHKGQPFTLYKFRSMHENVQTGDHEKHVAALARSNASLTKLDETGDDRIIPGGSLMRRAGLDELPQLINVLRGEMSIVGPRPCLPSEYDIYTPAQRERFDAPAGLTGYWQVNGKNSTTFTEMIALDIHYVRHRSVWMDLGIILRTPLVLIQQTMGRAPRVVLPFSEIRKRRISAHFSSLHRSLHELAAVGPGDEDTNKQQEIA